MAQSNGEVKLSALERAAVALGRATQENDGYKRFQHWFLRTVTQPWVKRAIARRVYADNLQWLVDFAPDRGVVLASNHRSFFDQWVNMLCLYERQARWAWRIFFPVRSNFFYEHVGGLLVNYTIGAGVMYPPIFRDAKKAALTKDAVDRMIDFLRVPGTLVGVHPEGTRGKGPDPYQLLPAQPGIGQIVLQAQPIVVPCFINGLANSVVDTVAGTYARHARRDQPVIVVYGDPVDYGEFASQKPRVALYKKTSDLIRERIIELIPREQELRERCARGEIRDDDPNWLL
jgi:1-acyl-sn-glycerol-3-phosphate acyltransferase